MSRPATFSLNTSHGLYSGLLAAYLGLTPDTSYFYDSSLNTGHAGDLGTQGATKPSWSDDGTLGRKAVALNGTDQFATSANTWASGLGQNHTIACWANVTASTTGFRSMWGWGTVGSPMGVVRNSNGYVSYFWGGDILTTGSAIAEATWTHIAYIKTSNVLKIYVNGSQAGSQANAVDGIATQYFNVGSGRHGSAYTPFRGSLADVMVWNRALSVGANSELAAVCSASDPTLGGLVRWGSAAYYHQLQTIVSGAT